MAGAGGTREKAGGDGVRGDREVGTDHKRAFEGKDFGFYSKRHGSH